MNLIPPLPQAPPDSARHIVLRGIGWEGYEKILDALAECPLRMTYNRGSLEIMSPYPIHEMFKTFFGRLFDMLAEELDIPLRACGSATFRRQDLDRGLEPDECFYLSSAARLADWPEIDLATDPPPDLAIEVEITRTVLDRLEVYAALGVPELWRFDGTNLGVYRLQAEQYQPCDRSPALPFLPLEGLPPLLQRCRTAADDRDVLRALRAWVRTEVAPAHRAATGPAGPGKPLHP